MYVTATNTILAYTVKVMKQASGGYDEGIQTLKPGQVFGVWQKKKIQQSSYHHWLLLYILGHCNCQEASQIKYMYSKFNNWAFGSKQKCKFDEFYYLTSERIDGFVYYRIMWIFL